MLILAIETAAAQVGTAVATADGVISAAQSGLPRRHAETLAPQIDFVRRQAGIELADVEAIAIDIGPGLYTGLRVGIASAVSMAWSLGVPMIGVSSLDIVAQGVGVADAPVVVALDARRGEVFWASYESNDGLVQVRDEPAVAKPAELGAAVRAMSSDDRPVVVVGDGALRHLDSLELPGSARLAHRSLAHPRAEVLAELALSAAERGELVEPSEVEPMYLRRPDAEVNWVTRETDRS